MPTVNNSYFANVLAPLKSLWEAAKTWFSAHEIGLLYFVIGVMVSVAVSILLSWIIRSIVKKLVLKTETDVDDKMVDALHKPLFTLLLASGIIMSLQMLKLEAKSFALMSNIYSLIVALCITIALVRVLNVLRDFFMALAKKSENVYDDLLIGLVFPAVKTVVWIIAVLFIAENIFKFNVTALLAGAGVAAMAVAFAAQNTIANIFGALSLITDRPFLIGDTIVINGKRGSVTEIGLRSTKVRSLDGTIWSIPNKEMSEATIENVSKRPNIKQVFDFGLVYSTTPEQMKQALEIVKNIFENCPLTNMELNPPLISFEALRDSSMNIQAVQWFQTGNYMEFIKAREEINFEIIKRFGEAGLEFAYPSQTLYLAADENHPVKVIQCQENK